MNALIKNSLVKPKPRPTLPAEPLDFDDIPSHGWEAVIESRERHRRRLAAKFSPIIKRRENDSIES